MNATIYVSEKLQIRIQHEVNIVLPSSAGASMEHDCALVLNFSEPNALEDVAGLATSLSTFLTLALGFYAEIIKIELRPEGACPILCHRAYISSNEPTRSQIGSIPFAYPQLRDCIQTILENWFAIEGSEAEAATITAHLLQGFWRMPYDLRFVAVSQAFEAFTKVGTDLKALAAEEHARRRQMVLDSIEDDDLRKWTEPKLNSNTKGQKRLVNEFCDANKTIVEWIAPDVGRFESNCVGYRNRFTHRSKASGCESSKDPSPEELVYHTEALHLICYCFVWKQLGLEEETIIQRIKRSSFKSASLWNARRLYGTCGENR